MTLFTLEEVTKIVINCGIDTTCGACVEVAFTGITTAEHTCTRPADRVQMVDGVLRPIPWPGETPLLQCIDCKNTESPAGAMARYFNNGRCLHCGGWFKVVRA